MSQALAAPDDETLPRSGQPAEGDESWPQALGDYRLVGLLGRGGMGEVFEAVHLPTGRRLALKRLGQRLDSLEMRQRFLREGRLAASVSHPNSLYVFGSEDISGVPVITMEIAESGTLKDRLDKRGPLPIKEAVDAMLDVISGLEAAQVAGVLHRDVKPSNCFLSSEGAVKVGDYGLSISALRQDDSYATASGLIMGTPAYASPEQLRGDELDLRGDIYSVGATLFTLLTGRAPFDGQNAVQVVANAVHLPPKKASELRDDLPPELERIVGRCLAKEPAGRFASYASLRDALLPFSSHKLEPVPMQARAAAGWIDFLLAFLVPYVALMLLVGSATFHFGWLTERTFSSARYYLIFVGFGLLYFTVAEGFWGAGFGKRRKGLLVIRPDGQRPGPLRALIRILSPLLVIEAIRLPLLFSTITATRLEDVTGKEILFYTALTMLCPWISALSDSVARRANGFRAPWDFWSGTRVVFKPTGVERPLIGPLVETEPNESEREKPGRLGPYRVDNEILEGHWLAATDTVLQRAVWLLKRADLAPSDARQELSRPGRPRWLQKVEHRGVVKSVVQSVAWSGVWDAYEASPGKPFRDLAESAALPWSDLRHWLHDLASEMWAATSDQTLPRNLSLDHIWLTTSGRAVLLDWPWPSDAPPCPATPVDDLAGQQRFLSQVARKVESTVVPLHARQVLKNLHAGRFEKLSFLAGTLRGLLGRPASLGREARAGALFMLPIYTLIMVIVGSHEDRESLESLVSPFFGSIPFFAVLLVLASCAVAQLLVVPLRTTTGHSIFRLAVIDARGQPASRVRLLGRWALAWLPLVAGLWASAWAQQAWSQQSLAGIWPRIWLGLWLVAALMTALDPHRGLHDRLAGTWVVKR